MALSSAASVALSAYADGALASRRLTGQVADMSKPTLRTHMRHCPPPSGDEVAPDLFLRVHLSRSECAERSKNIGTAEAEAGMTQIV